MTDIANKTAFVTGAASGIGLALTKALLARGAKVMMADMNAKGLKAAQASLGSPENTATIVCDVSDAACLLYTSPSPRDKRQSRMPSSA